ncbi:MAG: YifB family Mg chelatase-like AAA ATPase [Actinomycetaceae bacterium]|nr:YifB family Mg chelatase-like AAA ATPase [Actinomycetaceae bacterium]
MSRSNHTWSVAIVGTRGHMVRVEARSSQNLPTFTIIGMPDSAIREASHRVRGAIHSALLPFPDGQLTVNLAPAALRKSGSGFDLAIAVALIANAFKKCQAIARQTVYLGECGLDGTIHPVRGVLPAVLAAVENGYSQVVVPAANAEEARLIPGAQVVAVANFGELAKHLKIPGKGKVTYPEVKEETTLCAAAQETVDMADVMGQDEARIALEIAAAGGHHLMLLGTPGSGKTMLAKRLPTILPELADAEAIETTAIHSVAGTLDATAGLIRRPPFIAPHHNITAAAMIGGGATLARPGAVSLANHGVLFLDEAPEFAPSILDCLRQPLESGELTIHRSGGSVHLPAKFQLILAANPCPCGYWGHPTKACKCPPYARIRYLNRLSGPLMDRIDLRVNVYGPLPGSLTTSHQGDSSATVLNRVKAAREFQAARGQCGLNAAIPSREITKYVSAADLHRLNKLVEHAVITMRGRDRIIRVARTIADLREEYQVRTDAIQQAFALRGETND